MQWAEEGVQGEMPSAWMEISLIVLSEWSWAGHGEGVPHCPHGLHGPHFALSLSVPLPLALYSDNSLFSHKSNQLLEQDLYSLLRAAIILQRIQQKFIVSQSWRLKVPSRLILSKASALGFRVMASSVYFPASDSLSS